MEQRTPNIPLFADEIKQVPNEVRQVKPRETPSATTKVDTERSDQEDRVSKTIRQLLEKEGFISRVDPRHPDNQADQELS